MIVLIVSHTTSTDDTRRMSTKANLSVISELNNSRAGHLVLLAWHRFKIDNAKEAVITNLTDEAFTVHTRHSKGSQDNSYTFSKSEQSLGKDLKDRVDLILTKYASPRIPPMAIHSVNIWAIGLIGALPAPSFFILAALKTMLMKVFIKELYAQYFLGVVAFLHALEMLYVVFALLPPLQLPTSTTFLWAIWTFVLGYPITSRAQELNALHTKSSKKSS